MVLPLLAKRRGLFRLSSLWIRCELPSLLSCLDTSLNCIVSFAILFLPLHKEKGVPIPTFLLQYFPVYFLSSSRTKKNGGKTENIREIQSCIWTLFSQCCVNRKPSKIVVLPLVSLPFFRIFVCPCSRVLCLSLKCLHLQNPLP